MKRNTEVADHIVIFGGSGSPRLTLKICKYLNLRPGAGEVLRFSDGNLFVRVKENVRGRDVYVVQSTVFPTNDNFMELLFWIDALKRASAESVTVVMPYFSYAKGDKKDEPRVSIRARVCADAIAVAGADRVVTLDLHAPQIQGFFHIPVDDLYALPVLGKEIKRRKLRDLVVVSPDIGFAKQARKYASFLGASIAIADKQRQAHDERAEILEIIGEVQGKTALLVDDFTISAGTLVNAAEKLVERGARAVYAAVSHGVFSEGSMERLERSPIQSLLVTDSIETQPVVLSHKVEVVSVAPLFGEAIRRIHDKESISVLFPA
ncbi:MAG TPA: ribose-phosphate pyrophosphokinase [Candidatus Binataceae bacterium]|nr:ribose-phosphate pyrophosphokinase [Candidatus Binataceae bacterium]